VIPLKQHGDVITFSLKVHPKARRDAIVGAIGESLKLDLRAPAIDGQANEACLRFLADLLKAPRSSITIAAGTTSRNKVIRVVGVSKAAVERALIRAR